MTKTGPTRTPTIRDVAAAAGLAVGTVSRVINGQQSVSVDAQQRVLRAVHDLDYRPNARARSLRTGRSRNIGYCVRDITNPLFSTVARAAEAALEMSKFSLLVGNSLDSPAREREIVRTFIEQNVDGLILSPSSDSGADIVALAESHGIPVTVLDRDSPEPSDRIMTDHIQGVQQATSYLLDLGHRDIALITGSQAIFAGRARAEGVRRAFAARGLIAPEHRLFSGAFTRQYGEQIGNELLRRVDRPTAILCGGTPILLGLLPVVHDCDLEIPRQLSLICCDDIDLTRLYRPAITVVRRDMERVGTLAAKCLLDRLEGRRTGVGLICRIPTDLVVRNSCAPPDREPN